MSMRALNNVYTPKTGWAPIAVTATKTSSAIDFANCIENQIVVTPGLYTDGTSYTFTLTHSNTAGGAGTYTAISTADFQNGSFTVVTGTATAQTPQQVAYIGQYQYVKVVCTVVGATTGCIFGVQAMAKQRKMP